MTNVYYVKIFRLFVCIFIFIC